MTEPSFISPFGRNATRAALVGALAGAVASLGCSTPTPDTGPPAGEQMYASDGGNSDETPPDGSTVVGDATPIPIDGSMEASLGDGGEAGPCLGTLAQVASTFAISGRCPDTEADGIEAGLCGTNSFPNLRGSCGGLAMLGFNWGTHLQYCFYPGDGGALVAATAYDDQPSFCGGTSYTISSGSVVETGSAGASPIWSVSGQTCDMPAPTYFDCSPVDASGN